MTNLDSYYSETDFGTVREWLGEWYCEHGYFEGVDCPDCDCPSWYPESLADFENEPEDWETLDYLASFPHESGFVSVGTILFVVAAMLAILYVLT